VNENNSNSNGSLRKVNSGPQIKCKECVFKLQRISFHLSGTKSELNNVS
jgi:hypothetical protein